MNNMNNIEQYENVINSKFEKAANIFTTIATLARTAAENCDPIDMGTLLHVIERYADDGLELMTEEVA